MTDDLTDNDGNLHGGSMSYTLAMQNGSITIGVAYAPAIAY